MQLHGIFRTDFMSPTWLWVILACNIFVGPVVLIVFLYGLAVFRANVIQFGMDQLQDSPARDSLLFIQWFLITFYSLKPQSPLTL